MVIRDPANTAMARTAGTARRDDGHQRAEVRHRPKTKAFLYWPRTYVDER